MSDPILKPARLTARLPSVAVDAAMKAKIQRYAEVENIPMSAVVRYAVALFLKENYGKVVENTNNE